MTSRFGGNDKIFVWDSGETSLTLLNTTTWDKTIYDDFWMYVKMRRKMQGVFTLASKDGSRIFGLGIDRLTGEDILIYNKGKRIRINLTMETY